MLGLISIPPLGKFRLGSECIWLDPVLCLGFLHAQLSCREQAASLIFLEGWRKRGRRRACAVGLWDRVKIELDWGWSWVRQAGMRGKSTRRCYCSTLLASGTKDIWSGPTWP